MNNETKQFIQEWITKANEDLLVINKLTEFEVIAATCTYYNIPNHMTTDSDFNILCKKENILLISVRL